jgi:exodeoxyribonuclease V alpha subunit
MANENKDKGNTPATMQRQLFSPGATESLQGEIQRITFANDENGYAVIRLKVKGHSETVTAVGTIISPKTGDILNLTGHWSVHPRFGKQFQFESSTKVMPTTAKGIEAYLASGIIKGIGPVMARRIVERFGEKTLDVMDRHMERLSEVEGLGEKRTDMMREAWQAQKAVQDVMLFLTAHGVTPGYATKIFKKYGRDAIPLLTENPYRMAEEISGIGFLIADRIAKKLGFPGDHPLRLESGIVHTLGEVTRNGHVYYPEEALVVETAKLLQADREPIAQALEGACRKKMVILEEGAVYLRDLHLHERGLAAFLADLLERKDSRQTDVLRFEEAIGGIERDMGLTLAENQREAVRVACTYGVMICTGGPGTGKTTMIRAIAEIYKRQGLNVTACAPTGRAAKRMSASLGFEAKTIHRTLEYSPQSGAFQRSRDNPLPCDLIIVDEMSMVDTSLMYFLLRAVPVAATVILVGDIHQLPSVGPGNVLKDLIDSGMIPVVRLTRIFRQAEKSNIVVNAHKINSGHIPTASDFSGDCTFIEKQLPEEVTAYVLHTIGELCRQCEIEETQGEIPGLRPTQNPRDIPAPTLRDCQVIVPMNRGVLGTDVLNDMMQAFLNPNPVAFNRAGRKFKLGDKVMQIRNNYDRDVYNGDIGCIAAIDGEAQEIVVVYDGRGPVVYDYEDVEEIALAYAITIHKSQGSEYRYVIVICTTNHWIMLQRSLLYTAITRGKEGVILVGTRRALATAVRNDKPQLRYTRLRERLLNG